MAAEFGKRKKRSTKDHPTMKTTTVSNLALLVLSQVLSVAENNVIKDYVIGLSPHYVAAERPQIERRVRDFVLAAPKGSKIRCDDAFALQTITTFSVPDVKFDSQAVRLRAVASQLMALSQWFKKNGTNAVVTSPSGSGQLRPPEYLDFVASDGGGPRSILIIGGPLMEYPTEPSFSMTGGEEGPRVPSDGHLLAPLTSTPYGCAERKGRLRGSQISWCYGSENVWSNGLHKTLVTRFWTLFANQQDAALVSFTADLGGAFSALTQTGRGAVANFDLNPDDNKIEMRVARPRQVPAWLPQAGAETNTARVVSAAAQNRPTVSPSREAAATARAMTEPVNLTAPVSSTVDIGLMWSTQADIDLFVCARPGAAELSYQRVRTPEGAHIHDYRSANSGVDFEWVKLNPGVRFGEIEAWANLFQGRGPVSGRVAVHYQNRVYTGSFTIPAASGNGGVDAATRQNSPHWTRLNLQQILNQNP
jgi:surface antigen